MFDLRTSILCISLIAEVAIAQGQAANPVRARLLLDNPVVTLGKPVWVTFILENPSDESVSLSVPEVPTGGASLTTGLPLEHVFSGLGFQGLMIEGDNGPIAAVPVGFQPPEFGPAVTLGPHAVIGLRVEVSAYYSMLKNAGTYRLSWRPYGGRLASNDVVVEIAPLKQAVIWTDEGMMTVRFLYDEAPNHVRNFIDLANSGFYENNLFHRILPGYSIMGGDPRGDGAAVRPDGRKLPAEFNGFPQDRGTVSMSLLNDDPESASCQFFIGASRVPEWDGRYTAFGQLVGEKSFATLDKLMAAEVDGRGVPRKRIPIRSVKIVNAPSDVSPVSN